MNQQITSMGLATLGMVLLGAVLPFLQSDKVVEGIIAGVFGLALLALKYLVVENKTPTDTPPTNIAV